MRRAFRVLVSLFVVGSTSVVEPCDTFMCTDEGFGIDGRVVVDFPYGDADRGNAVVRVPGRDRLYIIGQVATSIAADQDFGVACLLGDGSECPDFGVSGRATVAMDLVPGGVDAAIDGAVIPWPATDDWRLAVVGQVERSAAGDTDYGVALLRPDGSLESDVAGYGRTTAAFDVGSDFTDVPAAVVATADGKILVGGTIDVASDDSDWGFVRLNADLSPDVGFGTNSRAILDVAGLAVMHDMLLQPDGKIIAVGSRDFGNGQMVIARLNEDGSPDITFGFLGQTVFEAPAPGTGDAVAWGVATDDQGRHVLVGESDGATGSCLVSARVLADGQPDGTFAWGSPVEAICTWDLGGRRVQILHDGHIIMATDAIGASHNFAVFLKIPEVSPGGWLFQFPFDLGGTNDDRPRGMLIQPDGKIVLAGRVVGSGGTIDFGVLRVWTHQIFADGFEPLGSMAEWDLVVYDP